MAFGLAPAITVHSSFSRGALNLAYQQRCSVQAHPTVRRRCVIECRRGGGTRDSGTSRARERRRGDGRRPSRVGEMIYREITPIVEDAFANAFEGEDTKDSGPVVVSVEGVSLTPDLRTARVRVTVQGSVAQKRQVLKWLKQTSKSLRFELAQCIHMKYVPELSFGESDEPSAVRTVDLLERLERERKEKGASQKYEAEDNIKQAFDMEDAIFAGDDDDGDEGTIGPSYMLQTPRDDEDDDKNVDDDDIDDDDNIVNVDESDEDLEEMSDEKFRRLVYGRIDGSGETKSK